MKRLFISTICLMTTLMVSATDIWEGSHAVDWSNTLNIAADKFVDVAVGQKIVVELNVTEEDVIELHSNGSMLPGTRYVHRLYADNTSAEVFVTQGMLDQLKDTGMEVCGKGFTVTKIWYGDGKDNVTAETVWTGYFWMDNWSTLEIAKTSFNGIDWNQYKAIRFYSEAGRTDYVINVKVSWEDAGHIADASTMTMTNEYAELNIEEIDMAAKLANVDRLMIQCNKEGGNPFNFTAVVLVPKDATGIKAMTKDVSSSICYDLSGRIVSANKKGIVIRNGGKYINK